MIDSATLKGPSARTLIIADVMGLYWTGNQSYALVPEPPEKPDERDQDSDEAPETPLDEPRPPRIQDPPPQPDQKGPYTVQTKFR
jgi:hypothetical protein